MNISTIIGGYLGITLGIFSPTPLSTSKVAFTFVRDPISRFISAYAEIEGRMRRHLYVVGLHFVNLNSPSDTIIRTPCNLLYTSSIVAQIKLPQ